MIIVKEGTIAVVLQIVTDYCLEVTRRDKYDPMDLVDEVTEIFEFNSSRACLQVTKTKYTFTYLQFTTKTFRF